MLTDYSTPVTSEQKFRVSLKNPRTGALLKGDCEYNSLMEAHRAAENWKESQYLKHWYVVVQDRNGVTVADDSPSKPQRLQKSPLIYRNGRALEAA
jgi:hypothetical protein